MMEVWALTLVSALVLGAAGQEGGTLEEFIQTKEDAVTRLASKGEELHGARCRHLESCYRCSIPACGSDFPASRGFMCSDEFGSDVKSDKDTKICGEGCTGMVRSVGRTVVRVAPNTDFAETELHAFVCASNNLEDAFAENHRRERTLNAFQYVGHHTGAIRIYPGAPQEREDGVCSSYDPRMRPWYVAGASGPKDVVVLIDASESMNEKHSFLGDTTRLKSTVRAVTALLDTMTHNDFVAVVVFSTDVSVVGNQNTLLRGTESNINTLKKGLDAYRASGGTKFSKGFSKAFELLKSSSREDATSGCTKVIIFLTDGKNDDAEGVDIFAEIAKHQESFPQSPAHILTYSMGKDHQDTPKRIACENRGTWAHISQQQDPLTLMTQYYRFLAVGIDSSQVRWTTPYEDAFGLGTLVTAAKVVFAKSKSIPLLVGVAGADVKMSDLERYGNYEEVVEELIRRSRTCSNFNLTECQMQQLRQETGLVCSGGEAQECPGTAPDTCSSGSSRGRSVNDFFCEELNPETRVSARSPPTSYRDVVCCQGCPHEPTSEDYTTLIGVMVAIGVLALVIGTTFIVWWGKKSPAPAPPPLPLPQECIRVQPSAPPLPYTDP